MDINLLITVFFFIVTLETDQLNDVQPILHGSKSSLGLFQQISVNA